jgi:hypothetical protein
MALSFVETMRGWLRGKDGKEFPVSFELVATGVRRGHFEVRGLLAAPPLAAESPARGTLEMGIGSIAYHLEFTSGGQHLRLDATKHPTLLAPLRSMTRMIATITDESGNAIASGEMRFELTDLPVFLASWLPVSRKGRRVLDTRRRSVERQLLSGDPHAEASS